MLTPSQACSALIRRFEGLQTKVYADPKTGSAPYTVGYGHTGPDVHLGAIWAVKACEDALVTDITHAWDAVARLLSLSPTSQGQLDALVSFAFNVGVYGTPQHPKLRESTLLRKHKAGDFAGAADEFLKWINKGSPVEAGLRTRRAAERALYLGISHA